MNRLCPLGEWCGRNPECTRPGLCGFSAYQAAMVERVRLFLSLLGKDLFCPWPTGGKFRSPRKYYRGGYRKGRNSPGGPAYYVEVEVFRSEICADFEPWDVACALSRRGALRLGDRGEFIRKERLPDGRRARVYVILPDLLRGDGDSGSAKG